MSIVSTLVSQILFHTSNHKLNVLGSELLIYIVIQYFIGGNIIECVRPSGWCVHTGATYIKKDCDGDGLADPVCQDDSGQFGSVLSSNGCKDTWPYGTCIAGE